jgi:nucleoside-diphosphate-sugar epimerase
MQQVILAARRHGARRLVYASSSSVYGVQDVPRVVESTPLKPITLYSRYKGEIEDFLNAHVDDGFVGVSVRSATVCGYSPRMRLDLLLNLFCWLALRQGTITIEGGSQIRPLIHMQDVVDFYLLLLEADAGLVQGQAFNVSSGNYTVQQVADMVAAYTGCSLTYTGVVDARSYPLDAEKAERVLGYRTRRTIDEAMVEVCDAIRAGRIDGSSANFNLRRYRELVGSL